MASEFPNVETDDANWVINSKLTERVVDARIHILSRILSNEEVIGRKVELFDWSVTDY